MSDDSTVAESSIPNADQSSIVSANQAGTVDDDRPLIIGNALKK